MCVDLRKILLSFAAEAKGVALADPDAREIVYGMPYPEWQSNHQKEATAEQKAAYAKANPGL